MDNISKINTLSMIQDAMHLDGWGLGLIHERHHYSQPRR